MINRELIERCNSLSAELLLKNREISRLKKELEKLKAYKEKATSSPKKSSAVKAPELSEDILTGAAIIGRLVIEATRYSNRLTADGEARYRELVNLILGQTEATKAKIYELAVSNAEPAEKYAKMEQCCSEAFDYFESVMQQREVFSNENM